jgi:hypothetical protein
MTIKKKLIVFKEIPQNRRKKINDIICSSSANKIKYRVEKVGRKPPVKKRKAPVKKVKPPVKKRKAPVKKVKPPVKKRKAPVTKVKAPVKKRKALVKKVKAPDDGNIGGNILNFVTKALSLPGLYTPPMTDRIAPPEKKSSVKPGLYTPPMTDRITPPEKKSSVREIPPLPASLKSSVREIPPLPASLKSSVREIPPLPASLKSSSKSPSVREMLGLQPSRKSSVREIPPLPLSKKSSVNLDIATLNDFNNSVRKSIKSPVTKINKRKQQLMDDKERIRLENIANRKRLRMVGPKVDDVNCNVLPNHRRCR